jgi:hypothetical protein
MITSALAVVGLGLFFVALPHLRLERWADRATGRWLARMGMDPDRARETVKRPRRCDRVIYAIVGGVAVAAGAVVLVVGLADVVTRS